jgi:DNA helicase HerA-like ATPase
MLLLDSRDLTTHGVIIGMTGSGKTGLGVGLIEEAAIDRIPVIAIDPKGDLPNLLLTFPDLAPADFRPWVNEDVARQRGVDPRRTRRSRPRRGARGWRAGGRTASASGACASTPTSPCTRPAARPASPCRCCARSTPRRRR